jgi:hypothetical protein
VDAVDAAAAAVAKCLKCLPCVLKVSSDGTENILGITRVLSFIIVDCISIRHIRHFFTKKKIH